MEAATSKLQKALRAIVSVVMAVSLMPLPAYAANESSASGAGLVAGVADLGGGADLGDDGSGSIGHSVSASSLQPFDVEAVTIGTGTLQNNKVGPYRTFNSYTISEQIYTAAEIGSSGTISAISFNVGAVSALSTNKVLVYLGHTQKEQFDSAAWLQDDLTLVYSGSPSLGSALGWEKLSFNGSSADGADSFSYNGTDNLLVVVVRNGAKYATSLKYNSTNTNSNQELSGGTDSDFSSQWNSLSEALGTGGISSPELNTSRPNIQIDIEKCAHVNTTFVQTVAPTCEDKGYDLYHCSDCGNDIKLNETAALGHAWPEEGYRGDKDGTASLDGKFYVYRCTRDASHIKTEPADPRVWDGEAVAEKFAAGTGTKDDPYVIATCSELAYLAKQVNGGTPYSGAYFKQSVDLDLDGNAWTPIGDSSSHKFAGIYDGKGHSIEGLDATGSNYVGLFGNVTGSSSAFAEVKGLTVSGNVSCTSTSTGNYAAGIVAYGSYVHVSECASEVTVTSTAAPAGGVVGSLTSDGSSVIACANRGQVSGAASNGHVGGVVGATSTSSFEVSDCYNTGDVTGNTYMGGIIGYIYNYSAKSRVVKNCYNLGRVSTSNTNYSTRPGGIVGYLYGTSSYTTYCTVSNCYSLSGAAAQDVIGYPTTYYGTVTDCSAKTGDDMKESSFVTTLGSAYISGVTYPALYWEAPKGVPEITGSALKDAVYAKDASEVAALSVTAVGDASKGDLVYQWYKATKSDLSDASAIVDATDSSYIPTVTEIGDSYYYCAVHNDVKTLDGSGFYLVKSAIAHMLVWSGKSAVAPKITAQPTSVDSIEQLATSGNTLNVAASFAGEDETGDNCELSYQWQSADSRDGTFEDVADATEATLAASTAIIGTKYYRCVVTNTREGQSEARAISDVVSVTVTGKTISNEAELKDFRDAVNNGATFAGATITLSSDISLNDDWTPIGTKTNPFKGEFDGGGHMISNVQVNSSSLQYAGFFGYIDSAKIENLRVNGAVSVSGSVAGTLSNWYCLGGIAGYANASTFESCGNEIAVSKTGTGTYRSLGGIAGVLAGANTLNACYNKADIKTTQAAAYVRVGGLVGNATNTTTLSSCYNVGSVENLGTSNCYTGGLTGYYGKFSNSYNSGSVTGKMTYTGGLSGDSSARSISDSADYCYVKKGVVSRNGSSVDYALGNTTDYSYFVFVDDEAESLANLNSTSHAGTWASGGVIGQTSPILKWEQPVGTPVIANQPESGKYAVIGSEAQVVSVTAAKDADYEGTASAEGVLSYQWYSCTDSKGDVSAVAGATGQSFTPPHSEAGVYHYFCRVTNTWNSGSVSIDSNVVYYVVLAEVPKAPTFVSYLNDEGESAESGDQTVNEDETVTLKVSFAAPATSDGLEYQWYSCSDADKANAVAIDGATAASYIVDTDRVGTFYYYCEARNNVNGALSDPAYSASAVVKVNPTLIIEDASGMASFSTRVSNGESFEGKTVVVHPSVGNTIDLTDAWTPIGTTAKPFKGTFEGSGANFTLGLTGTTYQALFGYVQGATINDVVVRGSVSGTQYVAGIVAYVSAASGAQVTTINNCGNYANVTASNAGMSYAGGIVGYAYGPSSTYPVTLSINGCFNKGTIELTSTTGTYVGGIIGCPPSATYYINTIVITDCYNTGTVKAATTGSAYAGGIAGAGSSKFKLVRCYSTGELAVDSSAKYAGALAGYNNGGPGTSSNASCFFTGEGREALGYSTASGYADSAATRVTAFSDENLAVLNSGAASTWIAGDADQASPYLAWEAAADQEKAPLTLNVNGGSWNDGVSVPTRYPIGAKTVLPTADAIARAGYEFNGWFDNVELSGEPKTFINTSATSAQEFWAKWTPVEYVIDYSENEGIWTDGYTAPVAYTVESETIALPTSENIVREGCAFLGWYKDGDFASEDNKVTAIAAGSTGDLALKARWGSPIKLGNIEEASWASGYTAPAFYDGETAVALPTSDQITREGYAFKGWFSDAGFESGPFTQIAESGDGATTALTLYAKWVKAYAVTYELNGGENAAANPATYAEGDGVASLAEPTRDGYTFLGWFDNAALTGTALTAIAPETAGAKTLYAKWNDIAQATITPASSEFTYNAQAIAPSFTVKIGDTELSSDDFTVSYLRDGEASTDLVTAGGLNAILAGQEGFAGTQQVELTILPASASNFTVAEIAEQTFTGSAIEPTVVVTGIGGEALEKGRDYEVAFSVNDKVGTAKVTITGMRNYTGDMEASFEIVPTTFADAGVTIASIPDQKWTGKAIEPTLILTTSAGAKLIEGTDYTVQYANNIKGGTAEVTVKGIGGYLGSADLTATFKIVKLDNTVKATATNPAAIAYSTTAKTIVNPVKVVGAKGTVTYTKTTGDNGIKVAGNGTITVSAGQPAGTYAVKVKVTAAGDDGYAAGSVTVSYSVTVKKATNTLAVTASNPKAVTFRTGAQTIANPLKVSGAKGKVSYAGTVGKYLKVNSSTGEIAVAAKTPAGSYTLKITVKAAGDGNYESKSVNKSVKITVNKAANTLKVQGKTAKVSFAKLKKANQALNASAVLKVTANAGKGGVTYKKTSGDKRISVAQNGKVTVKKGLKKGTYTVKVKATSKSTANYKSGTATVTFKVKVG